MSIAYKRQPKRQQEERKRTNKQGHRAPFQSPIPRRILKIKPTEGESVFESYFAVLSTLVGTREIFRKLVEESGIARVQEVKNKSDNPNTSTHDKRPIIYFFKPLNDGSTHYRVYSFLEKYDERKKTVVGKWTTTDPYSLYQKQKSQGFCQMFAYFIAVNDTTDFINKEYQQEADLKELHKHNTFMCLKKTIKLLEETNVIKKIISEQFEHIKYDTEVKYGIPDNMKYDDFIIDLKSFEQHDLNNYIESL